MHITRERFNKEKTRPGTPPGGSRPGLTRRSPEVAPPVERVGEAAAKERVPVPAETLI